MGGENQPISIQKNQQNLPKLDPSKHPRFLDAIIVESSDQNLYYEVTQSIGNILTYNSWEKKINQIKKKIGPNSLYLPLQCQYHQQGICGTAGTLKFKFQHYAFLLDQEIMNRQSSNLPFQEKEIWFLLYILTQTAAALHKVDFLVGDIRPKNIFINNSGDIAVYNMLSFPEDFTNFQKVRFFKESNYLSPEGVNDIQTGKQIPSYDEKLGQSFSIGLTILDAVFLTDHSFLYDKMERFNEIGFLKIIQSFQNMKLSQKLKTILSSMISINPQKRISCIQLCEYLQPYEKQIFQLQQFQFVKELQKQSSYQKVGNPAQSNDKNTQKQRKSSANKLISFHSFENNNDNYLENKITFKIYPNHMIDKVQPAQQKTHSFDILKSEKSKITFTNESSTKKTGYNLQSNGNFSQINTFQHISMQQKYVPSKVISFNNGNQFNRGVGKSNEKIDSNLLNQELYHITRPNFSKNFQMLGSLNQPVPAQTQLIKMTFNTGKTGEKQKFSTSILLSENSNSIREGVNLIKNNQGYKVSNSFQGQAFYPSKNSNQQLNKINLNTGLSNGSSSDCSDFLKNIQKQIQESRKMFPDSLR